MPDSTMDPPAGHNATRPSRLGTQRHTEGKELRMLRRTQHAQTAYLVHEEGRDDVSGQHGQRSQEVDEVDPVGAVVVVERHLAARLVVVEGAVDHSGVCEFGVVDIWKRERRAFMLLPHR